MFENPKLLLTILGISAAVLLAGFILMPTGAATLCTRFGQTVGGVKQDCRRCTSSKPCPCGGGGNNAVCRCDSTALPNVCFESYNSGSVAMIAIGVILIIVGVAGLIFLFGVKNSATMAALGKGKSDE
jgi:hypothetical protein